MATTLQMLEALMDRLRAKLPALAVEYFPDSPKDYRLNHPRGALLVSLIGSTFGESASTSVIAQRRTVKPSITVVVRQLAGRGGAVDVLDLVRFALVGYRLPDCRKMQVVSDHFLGQSPGLWQYAVDFSAETMQVEDLDAEAGPLLTVVDYEDTNEIHL